MPERFPRTLSPWFLRLLLAALLMFGSEVLLWSDPAGLALGEWLLRLPGYLALAALLLDLAERYRIKDVYDAMTLLAIYGLLNGLLLSPAIGLAEVPDTVVNRVLGGHGLLGLEMFGLFLVLTNGQNQRYRRLALVAAIWVGFYWGIWVRWSPQFTTFTPNPVTVSSLLIWALGGLGAILTVYLLALRRTGVQTEQPLSALDLRLSVIEWGLVLIVFLLLFIIRAAQNVIPTGGLLLILVLLIGCWAVLWFRRSERGQTLLAAHVPPLPLSVGWIGVITLTFVVTSLIAYHLPLVTLFGLNQFSLMTLGFAGVGLGWLPLIAMVLGVRALDHLARTGQV